MTQFPVAPRLPDEILAKRQLPLKPAPVTLEGQIVRLVPLDLTRDLDALYAVSNGQPAVLGGRSVEEYDADELIWRYMGQGPFASADEMAGFLQAQINAVDGLPMCVFDLKTGRQIGVANFMSNIPAFLKIELGNIWYSPLAQRTGANTEATYLMLKHAFGLGYRRLEWKCNALNQRSREAALKMGFTFEGIQQYHMIIKDRNRDTAWFRILDYEWEGVRAMLEQRLYGK
jgi:RimJ/RimL family protein N-acetyltransferase